MENLIKTRLAESKRITGLAKLTICIAVILSLTFTANVSAAPTLLVTLDGDSPATGSLLGTQDLSLTPYGTISFVGNLNSVYITPVDDEFLTAGASGNAFDIQGATAGNQWAQLSFSFDVISLGFVYGGNYGGIDIKAFDEYGNQVDFYSQSSTFVGQLAGPETLDKGTSAGIRSLYWKETEADRDFAALDNIEVYVSVIPAPTALVLAGIGVSFVSWLRKRKIV